MIEEVTRFGSNGSLVGILSRPMRSNRNLPAILLLNAGLVHRVGPNRIYVRLARHFAALGFSVLRFDFSGIGDIHDRYLSSGLKGWTQSPRCFVRDGSRRKTEAVAAIPWGGVTDAESPSPSY